MPQLLIRNETTGASWIVWPSAEPPLAGAVHETGSYLFELRDAPDGTNAELLIDDRLLEALRPTGGSNARWRWSPGFHAGTTDAELRIPGFSPRRFEIVTDPDLRKLTREDFDTMVREILEDTFALFSLSSFRKGIARGSGIRPPALARLEFLRSRINELESVVESVVRRPRHRLSAEENLLPYHRARRATGPEILKSFRSGRILSEQGPLTRLPRPLNGFLPQLIRVRKLRSSLDLPEHRQMGSCLRALSSWLSAVAQILARDDRADDAEIRRERSGWAARCRRLAHRVARMGAKAPFSEAGDTVPRLTLSAIFRNDPNYSRFFQLWQDINIGIAAIFGDFLNMPLARTFELYELWCFLRLVRAGADAFGPDSLKTGDLFISDAAGGLTIAAGAVTVEIGHEWKLCFQKRYREFWIEPDRRGSFSRDMTPDVAIVHEPADHPADLIIVDAKYRIEEGLSSALNSIHTYRDALVREADAGSIEGIVSAAYLLTPHVPEIDRRYRDTPLPGRLFHPEYRKAFRFGAVTMRPGMTPEQTVTALRTIIADAVHLRS